MPDERRPPIYKDCNVQASRRYVDEELELPPKKKKNLGKFQRLYIRTNEEVEEVDPQKRLPGATRYQWFSKLPRVSHTMRMKVSQDGGNLGRSAPFPSAAEQRDPKTKRGSMTPRHPLTLRI
jgi:hypothetical protein